MLQVKKFSCQVLLLVAGQVVSLEPVMKWAVQCRSSMHPERERDRQTETETDRQTDRQIYKKTSKKKNSREIKGRGGDRHRETKRDREIQEGQRQIEREGSKEEVTRERER